MEFRKIQKTGNMFYLYLPTDWCRMNGIKRDSLVRVNSDSAGILQIKSFIEEKEKSLPSFSIDTSDKDILSRFIVACYINPARGFNINLRKPLGFSVLLDQKKLISVEVVEFDGKHISCESSVSIENPYSILKTLMRKVVNMLIVMLKNYNYELIERYENEIDRSRLLIEKAVISGLMNVKYYEMPAVELHYSAIIAREVERLVDKVILLDKKDKPYMKKLLSIFSALLSIIDENRIDIHSAISFAELSKAVKTKSFKGDLEGGRVKLKNRLIKNAVWEGVSAISEVIFDWAITLSLQ